MANNRFNPKKPKNIIEGAEVLSEDSESLDEILESATSATSGVSNSDDFSSEEVSVEETTGNFTDESPKKAPVHNVKIKTRCDHRCCIGGIWYDFKKGVQCSVPEEVKTILLKSDLLMPI